MNVRMVDAAIDAMREVDVVGAGHRRDARSRAAGDRFLLDLVTERDRPVVLILNKIDLVEKPKLLPLIDEWQQRRDVRRHRAGFGRRPATTSSASSSACSTHLPDGEPLYPDDYLTDQPERFFVAEMVREQVLQHTHARAAVLDRGRRRQVRGARRRGPDAPLLHDPRRARSQKPIVIGRAATMIKRSARPRARSSSASSTPACSSICTSR